MSRTTRAATNMMTSLFGQLAVIVVGFACRTVFIHTLTAAYLGVGNLFSSILTVLNLSELGIGASITYALYKPLATDDTETIKALMDFYKKAYRMIGLAILTIALCLLPFLDKMIKGGTDLANVRIVFLLYIAQTVCSYWLFAYKRTLFQANQQKYMVTLYDTIFYCLISIVQIIWLLSFHKTPEFAFYGYTFLGVVSQILNNIFLSRAANRYFPYLKDQDKRKLTREEKKPIFKNVTGVFISKVSGIMLTSVDNILISAFISISIVGIYSNYIMLRTYVTKTFGMVFESITAGIGDYCARETLEKQESFFKTIQFVYFWVYGFCSICLWTLFNPFIGGVWINETYLLSNFAVILIVANFLLDGLSGAVIKFREANGLYWQAKMRYLFSAIFNGVLSYLLIKPLGIEGVLLGTTASILIMISVDPVIVFKNVFHKSALPYYLSFLKYLALVLATGGLITLIVMPFSELNVVNFIIKFFVCMIVPNLIWFLMFRKTAYFKFLIDHVRAVIVHFRSSLRKKKVKQV